MQLAHLRDLNFTYYNIKEAHFGHQNCFVLFCFFVWIQQKYLVFYCFYLFLLLLFI